MITVNALGLACPLPVVKTKEAIRELNGTAGEIRTLVDNDVAVQNLTKMAQQKGYEASSQQIEPGKIAVTLKVPGNAPDNVDEPVADMQPCDIPQPGSRTRNIVCVFDSRYIGNGDDELGAILTKSFIFALTKQDMLPTTLLFYNGGAFITTTESDTLNDLKTLADQGVRIITCGTCLNHFGLTDQLRIGEVGNMYEIAECMMNADHIIKP